MHAFLGCLFILIFGAFLFIIGIFRFLAHWLFGGSTHSNPWNQQRTSPHNNTHTQGNNSNNGTSHTHTDYTAGNAHHESAQNHSNKNGKIFDKNEGEYVDFEEV